MGCPTCCDRHRDATKPVHHYRPSGCTDSRKVPHQMLSWHDSPTDTTPDPLPRKLLDLTPDHPDTTEPYFASLEVFVRDYLCRTYRRNVGEAGRAEYRWSARWWETPEAVVRLEAMWRAWEECRTDAALGTSEWLRDHADPHMAVLMSPYGPWARSTDSATPSQNLPCIDPPPGYFAVKKSPPATPR